MGIRRKTLFTGLSALLLLSAAVFALIISGYWKSGSLGDLVEQLSPEAVRESPNKPAQRDASIDNMGEDVATQDLTDTNSADSPPGLEAVAEEFYLTKNYFDFVNLHLANAEAGDPASQYYVYRALYECEQWMDLQSHGRRLTLEDKLTSNVSDKHAQLRIDNHFRCVQFSDLDMGTYGSAADWLRAASQNGHSAAVSETALNRFFFDGDTNPDEGKELMRRALQASHPEAIWNLNYVYDSDKLGARDELRAMAARLLACERGHACDFSNVYIQVECAAGRWPCEQGDFVNALKVRYGDQFHEIEKLAESMDVAIRGKDWAALHLE